MRFLGFFFYHMKTSLTKFAVIEYSPFIYNPYNNYLLFLFFTCIEITSFFFLVVMLVADHMYGFCHQLKVEKGNAK